MFPRSYCYKNLRLSSKTFLRVNSHFATIFKDFNKWFSRKIKKTVKFKNNYSKNGSQKNEIGHNCTRTHTTAKTNLTLKVLSDRHNIVLMTSTSRISWCNIDVILIDVIFRTFSLFIFSFQFQCPVLCCAFHLYNCFSERLKTR